MIQFEHTVMMELSFELILKILGVGALAVLISQLELADKIFQLSRGLPQPFTDIGAILTLIIIFYAVRVYDRS